jgi:FkbM family methyltransferase
MAISSNRKFVYIPEVISLLTKFNIQKPVFVIAGGGFGESAAAMLKVWNKPYTLHLIEPLPKLVNELKNKFSKDENTFIHNIAVHATECKVHLHQTKDLRSSSLLSFTNNHNSAAHVVTNTIEVTARRLDTILSKIDFLELLVQGTELPALKGATSLLKNIKIVHTVWYLNEGCKGQSNFQSVHNFLCENNFLLWDLYKTGTRPQLPIAGCRVTYVNKSIL